ncbi:hypothetical protein WISP_143570 [Willisornis vidua]|uniref:Uncharacterized protein n=1 Tax=Willisornis vidua TaxID=1566151 RepID=A0ABQ9CMF0_9PASS|nr:hypothetical protein WISP_143570 [Willisornis vidua]
MLVNGWLAEIWLGLTAAAAAAAAATNAAIAEAMKVKKIKLEAMSNYHANNNQHGADSENGDLNSSVAVVDRALFDILKNGELRVWTGHDKQRVLIFKDPADERASTIYVMLSRNDFFGYDMPTAVSVLYAVTTFFLFYSLLVA